MNRRDFTRKTLTVAVGAALAPVVVPGVEPAARRAGGRLRGSLYRGHLHSARAAGEHTWVTSTRVYKVEYGTVVDERSWLVGTTGIS